MCSWRVPGGTAKFFLPSLTHHPLDPINKLNQQIIQEVLSNMTEFEVVNVVSESWDVIKRIDNHVDIAGELLFRR